MQPGQNRLKKKTCTITVIFRPPVSLHIFSTLLQANWWSPLCKFHHVSMFRSACMCFHPMCRQTCSNMPVVTPKKRTISVRTIFILICLCSSFKGTPISHTKAYLLFFICGKKINKSLCGFCTKSDKLTHMMSVESASHGAENYNLENENNLGVWSWKEASFWTSVARSSSLLAASGSRLQSPLLLYTMKTCCLIHE